MEFKEWVMLGVLLGVAVIGSGIVIYVLKHLDDDAEAEESAENENTHDSGH